MAKQTTVRLATGTPETGTPETPATGTPATGITPDERHAMEAEIARLRELVGTKTTAPKIIKTEAEKLADRKAAAARAWVTIRAKKQAMVLRLAELEAKLA